MTRTSGKSRIARSADWREAHRDWAGSADELVKLLRRLIRERAVPVAGSKPNVRLLRHYVSVGAVSRPERIGREAHFGYRHLVEYLVVRVLLEDGWPLAKIAELTSRASLDALLDYFESEPPTGAHVAAREEQEIETGSVRERRSFRAKDLVARYMLKAGEGAPGPEVPDSRTAALYRTSLRGRRLAGRWFDSEVEQSSEGRREVVRVTVEPGFVLEFDREVLDRMSRGEIESLIERTRRALESERRGRGEDD
jgi:hypothetical protein